MSMSTPTYNSSGYATTTYETAPNPYLDLINQQKQYELQQQQLQQQLSEIKSQQPD